MRGISLSPMTHQKRIVQKEEDMSKEVTQVATMTTQTKENAIPAIEITELCKTFGKFQAVDHLSLTVQQGEIFGLLGPNGSGKTTTINMMSGLSVPTSGEVKVMGYDIRHHARQVRQILGSVPQETALYGEVPPICGNLSPK